MADATNGSDGVLLKLAEELIGKWSKDHAAVWSERSLPASEVKNGLQFLLNSNLLKMADVVSGNKVTLAINAIKMFQDFAKMDRREGDGVFGRITRNVMQNFRNCRKQDEGKKGTLDADSLPKLMNANRNTNVIFFYIDPSVRAKIGDKSTSGLIAHAWHLWSQYADISIVRVDAQKDSNVVIEMKSIDGSGGTLGLSHVGGPGLDAQLLCTIDDDEDWTPLKFVVAACHEFGHILGLEDIREPGHLMSGILDASLSIEGPQVQDIASIRALWGKADAPGEGAMTPSDDFPGKFRFDLLESA